MLATPFGITTHPKTSAFVTNRNRLAMAPHFPILNHERRRTARQCHATFPILAFLTQAPRMASFGSVPRHQYQTRDNVTDHCGQSASRRALGLFHTHRYNANCYSLVYNYMCSRSATQPLGDTLLHVWFTHNGNIGIADNSALCATTSGRTIADVTTG